MLTLDDLREAHLRITPHIHRTPVQTSATLDALSGARIFFKCENLQKAGAFKTRGAVNAVLSLSEDEAARGVITHSSGNHAGALSYAARLRGIAAHLVMPRTAPRVKVAAVEGYGGRITFCEPTQEARESTVARLIDETGAVLIHPYDDDRIIAGASTASLELLEDAGPLDVLLAPVGGGGLMSGTALAAHFTSPATRVIACEPAAADDAARSFRAGRIEKNEKPPETLADGLRTSLSERTFTIMRDYVADVVTVDEEEIASAMRLVWERMKLVIEPSSAVVVAPLIRGDERFNGLRVGAIFSGGNVDLGG